MLLMLGYAGLMILYGIGWRRLGYYAIPDNYRPNTSVSVIIPARNEAANIRACIEAIMQQDYPLELVEIVVVDDFSEDDTVAIVRSIGNNRVKVIALKDVVSDGEAINSYKKKALSTGIANSTGALIVTTDADCIAGPEWLKSIAAIYEQGKAVMVIGPVLFTYDGSVLETFQSIDFTTMQGITVASQQLHMGSMANGANLAFSRAAYDNVKGYEGIDHLASGDDYLLLHKLKQAYPDDIQYLKAKEAVVRTAPQHTWADFLEQRIRWASKSGKYSDHRLTVALLLVYLFNVALLGTFIASIWVPDLLTMGLSMLVIKIIVELCFLYPVSGFFSNRKQLVWFPILQPLHIVYIVLAGFFGLWGKYQWKGRRVH